MENKFLILKIVVWPLLGAIFADMTIDKAFVIAFYSVATVGVIYTVIIPKYKRDKKHKQWVKGGCKKEDRYKWEDVQ